MNSIGLGLIPFILKAHSITAAAALPGIPSVRRDIMAPPVEALAAVSGSCKPGHASLAELLFLIYLLFNAISDERSNSCSSAGYGSHDSPNYKTT